MKKHVALLLIIALTIGLLMPLVAIGAGTNPVDELINSHLKEQGQPTIEDYTNSGLFTKNEEEPTKLDKIIEPLIGMWYLDDFRGQKLYIVGKQKNDVNDYIVLYAELSPSLFDYSVRSTGYYLKTDPTATDTFYFYNDSNMMYKAVLDGDDLTIAWLDPDAAGPSVYHRLGK